MYRHAFKVCMHIKILFFFSILSTNLFSICPLSLLGLKQNAKVYYAHPLNYYDKSMERRDVKLLSSQGLQVINPNDDAIEKQFQLTKDFSLFTKLASASDAVAVRAFADKKLGAGVAKEALDAIAAGKIAFEIRKGSDRKLNFFLLTVEEIKARELTIAETIEYLDYYGVVPRIKY
jgi:hypothetical protein